MRDAMANEVSLPSSKVSADWGIYPRGVSSMGLDALEWPNGEKRFEEYVTEKSFARTSEPDRVQQRKEARSILKKGVVHTMASQWTIGNDRKEIWDYLPPVRAALHNWLFNGDDYASGEDYAKAFGLVIDENASSSIYRAGDGKPSMEVHSVRPAVRRTFDGEVSTDFVVEITQRRRGYFDPKKQKRIDTAQVAVAPKEAPDFIYRAGCTILINPRKGEIRRVITTRGTIADNTELERVRAYLTGVIGGFGNAFDAGLPESRSVSGPSLRREPFALLHRMED